MPRLRLEPSNQLPMVYAAISQALQARHPEADPLQLQQCVQHYLDGLALADVMEKPIAHWAGIIALHRQLALSRVAHEPALWVLNPNLVQHGWHSRHTLILVVHDDMPFLVDSISIAVNRLGLTVHMLVHPVMRGQQGDESWILLEVDHQANAATHLAMEEDLKRVLTEVRLVVDDWKPMRAQLSNIIDGINLHTPAPYQEDKDEALSFLHWLADEHFTFFGYRYYAVTQASAQEIVLDPVASTGLGILRDKPRKHDIHGFALLPSQIKQELGSRSLLFLTKANARSNVHRPGYLDYVGIKDFDEQGQIRGEHRILGLYTSRAYTTSPRDIPLIRAKIDWVLQRAGFGKYSHNANKLLHVLETHPRDELWDITGEQLYRVAMGIVQLQERHQVRLFVREDLFHRYFSCLVFVPRDNYSTEVRQRMKHILAEAFQALSVEFNLTLSESLLARIHFMVRTDPSKNIDYDVSQIEAALLQAAKRWKDVLQDRLLERFGEEQGQALFYRYAEAFSASYQELNNPDEALADVELMESLSKEQGLALSLRPKKTDLGDYLHFKVIRQHQPISLSQSLDILRHLGLEVLDEHPYRIDPIAQPTFWASDFGLNISSQDPRFSSEACQRVMETFRRVVRGDIDNDGFNGLVLSAGLSWREVQVFRAYSRYMRQLGLSFSLPYIEQCLLRHPGLVQAMTAMFHKRFHPEQRDFILDEVEEFEGRMASISSLDEDRILHAFINVLLATTRTNFYQHDAEGEPHPYLAFKFAPKLVHGMPEPRPMHEIFVYSRRMEGVHLRGGKVARGGIRWSDRQEDYRTEVLGLMKAQMVKNSIIVPLGAKGGFICKQINALEPAQQKVEVLECYRWFIRGLLDLTDNTVQGVVVPPERVERYDEDDPYLVVAADKGTATFSDVANSLAEQAGFWLGDAFASGGSHGYDHKALGITARGAWESLKLHREALGLARMPRPMTLVGIGDMSGDVFGNGLLLDPSIQLIAAFDHRHIFIDPTPDPAQSFTERQRLFRLPQSAWADYTAEQLSPGGMVVSRQAKNVVLSPQAQKRLGIAQKQLTPNELVQALLKAPVDVLYNAGIGTFVKASHQAQPDVRDRLNDSIRINARDLRCKMVVEGGNLGFTQAARVEYALHGGRIFTDGVDNSAGVHCSDREVNLKIVLGYLVSEGSLSLDARNNLLAELTHEVAEQVLQENRQQTRAIQISVGQAPMMLAVHGRFMQDLERHGRLNRNIEGLPNDEVLADRKLNGQGLTAPEIAVLLAYAKMQAYQQLLQSNLPDEFDFIPYLLSYFPETIRGRYAEAVASHVLRREIIATQLCNEILDHMGETFLYRLEDETGVDLPTIVRAWVAASRMFDALGWWKQINELPDSIDHGLRSQLQLELRKLLERTTRWILRNFHNKFELDELVQNYAAGLKRFLLQINSLLPSGLYPELADQESRLRQGGLPETMAVLMARIEPLMSALDIIDIDNNLQAGLPTIAKLYFAIGQKLQLDWLRQAINQLPRDNRWQVLARIALRDDVYRQHRSLVALMLQFAPKPVDVDACMRQWLDRRQMSVRHCMQLVTELKTQSPHDLAMLSAAVREFRNHLLNG